MVAGDAGARLGEIATEGAAGGRLDSNIVNSPLLISSQTVSFFACCS